MEHLIGGALLGAIAAALIGAPLLAGAVVGGLLALFID